MEHRYYVRDDDTGDDDVFATKAEVDKWIADTFAEHMAEGVGEEAMNGGIWWAEIRQESAWVETDNKANYKYEYEDDIPEDDTESEAWPYDNEFDTVGKLVMVDVKEAPDAE